MPIFSTIATAIAGALFTAGTTAFTIATAVIGGVLAFGTKLVFSYLTRDRSTAPTRTAVQGEMRFGAAVAADTIFGTGKIVGHRTFYAKWGAGNKFNAEVFTLANGWCDGLEDSIYFYDEKHTLVARDIIDNEAAHYGIEGFGDLVSIRFYDGRPDQGADTKLVADTADLGRSWKATSVAAGLCYVVVERQWDAEKFEKGRPTFEFVLRGWREYDVRKDSTVAGGSGSHRLNDPSTWEHTHNPAIHRFNYQLGLKGLISGRTLIGEGKSVGQLDLGSYVASMNACDALRGDGKKTYQCSLFVTGDDDHKKVLDDFDDAMCGYALNRRGLSGVIAGAPQIPVAEITDDDISLDRPKSVKFRRRAFERYNTISGQFISPESNWRPESLKTVRVNADVAADGRVRQISNDFLQITDPDLAQYCLNVRYRQNRKGGSFTIPVSRRLGFGVQEGEWVTYKGLDCLVTGWVCDPQLRIKLVLAETGADIYDDEDIDPGPIVIAPAAPINPSILSTIQGFDAQAGLINGAGGADVPALHFTWTPPEDPTIVAVRFFYQIDGDAKVFEDQCTDPESGSHYTTKNVVSGRVYVARATITPVPDRLKTFTAFVTTDETGNLKITLRNLQSEITADLQRREVGMVAEFSRLKTRVTDIATNIAGNLVERKLIERSGKRAHARVTRETVERITADEALAQDITAVQAEFDGIGDGIAVNAAAIIAEASARADADSALATDITAVQADVGVNAAAIITEASARADADSALATDITAVEATTSYGTASGLTGWSASSGPGGVDLRFQLVGRVTTGGSNVFGGMFFDLLSAGGSRFLFAATEFLFTDGSASYTPVVISGGQLLASDLKVQRANIINFTATWAEIQTAVTVNFVAGTANIGTLTVDTIHIKNNAVAAKSSVTASGVSVGPTYTTVASVTISNPTSAAVAVYCTMGGTFTAGSSAGAIVMRLINTTSGATLAAAVGNANPGNAGSVVPFVGTVIDISAGATATYQVQGHTSGDVPGNSLSGYMALEWNKK